MIVTGKGLAKPDTASVAREATERAAEVIGPEACKLLLLHGGRKYVRRDKVTAIRMPARVVVEVSGGSRLSCNAGDLIVEDSGGFVQVIESVPFDKTYFPARSPKKKVDGAKD